MDTMNKLAKKMISGLLCLCYALGADGQTLTDGQIAVQNLAVSKQEDKLFVAMDLDISALKQGSNREVLFTPSLTLEDDSLSLPPYASRGATVITTTCETPPTPNGSIATANAI